MADKIVTKSTTGHITFGTAYTVSAADATGTSIAFDFSVPFNVAAAVSITNSAGALYALTSVVLTYPTTGYVKIQNGGSYTLASGDVISIVATRSDV